MWSLFSIRGTSVDIRKIYIFDILYAKTAAFYRGICFINLVYYLEFFSENTAKKLGSFFSLMKLKYKIYSSINIFEKKIKNEFYFGIQYNLETTLNTLKLISCASLFFFLHKTHHQTCEKYKSFN